MKLGTKLRQLGKKQCLPMLSKFIRNSVIHLMKI